MKMLVSVIAASVLLVACDKPASEVGKPVVQQVAVQESVPVAEIPVPARSVDIAQLTRGGELYRQNCASCHGANGEGAPNWRQRDANGQFPPPPLNGSGHTWHHPLNALVYTIQNGTRAIGGNMPAWKGKLAEEDIYAVIAWFQSKWPERAYIAWYDIDQRARKRQ